MIKIILLENKFNDYWLKLFNSESYWLRDKNVKTSELEFNDRLNNRNWDGGEFEYYISLINDSPCGILLIYLKESTMYIKAVVVDEKFRNKKIGNNLLNFCKDHAKKLNKTLVAEVFVDNLVGLNLFSKNNFTFSRIESVPRKEFPYQLILINSNS